MSIGHLFNNPPSDDGERSALLGSTTTTSAPQYGTRETQLYKPVKDPSPFKGFGEKMKKLAPFLWPHHSYKLQLYAVLCFIFMGLGFAVNLLAPQQIGYIVDNLKAGEFSWTPIIVYVGLKFLQGRVKKFFSFMVI